MKKLLIVVLLLISTAGLSNADCDCPGDALNDMNSKTPALSTIIYGVLNPGGAAEEGKITLGAVASLFEADKYYDKMVVFDGATDISTGDGKFYIPFGLEVDGWNLTHVFGVVKTPATGTGTQTISVTIYNLTDAQDVLSTPLTIDEDEASSITAAAAYAVNTSYDDVDAGDLWEINVDGVPSTTPGTGL